MPRKNRESPPEPAEHGRDVAAMFGRIAPWYDFLNRLLSFGLDRHWRNRLVSRSILCSTNRVLDLAAGTLDVSQQISRRHAAASVLAMDFSLPMLRRGAQKMHRSAYLAVCANAVSLPLPAESVDSVSLAFGIRNIVPRSAAFAEVIRVLVPGGRLCILEFGSGQARIWGGVYNFYLRQILPRVGRMVSKDGLAYGYLAQTIQAFPTAERLAEELQQAGFEGVAFERLSSGIVYLHTAEKPQDSRKEPIGPLESQPDPSGS